MNPFGILGQVDIPAEFCNTISQSKSAWKASGSQVRELTQRRPWQDANGRPYLAEDNVQFISRTLERLGILEYDRDGHSLLVFGNVTRHNDDAPVCNGRPAAFFHLILSGSGTLRLPGLRDKSSRNLELKEGLAFWFNPRIAHLVKNASAEGVASFTAIVAVPRSRAMSSPR